MGLARSTPLLALLLCMAPPVLAQGPQLASMGTTNDLCTAAISQQFSGWQPLDFAARSPALSETTCSTCVHYGYCPTSFHYFTLQLAIPLKGYKVKPLLAAFFNCHANGEATVDTLVFSDAQLPTQTQEFQFKATITKCKIQPTLMFIILLAVGVPIGIPLAVTLLKRVAMKTLLGTNTVVARAAATAAESDSLSAFLAAWRLGFLLNSCEAAGLMTVADFRTAAKTPRWFDTMRAELTPGQARKLDEACAFIRQTSDSGKGAAGQ
jgi:hypothetical protein